MNMEKSKNNLKLYSVKEASALLGIGKNRMYDLIKSGVIKVLKVGGIKIRAQSLEEFLEEYDGCDLTDPDHITKFGENTSFANDDTAEV